VIAIGFRSFPDGFAYVVLEGAQDGPSVIACQRLKFPKNHGSGASLSWLRKQVIEILNQHQPDAACIKCVEPMAKKKVIERFHVDAVIAEATFSERGCECTFRIKSQLKRDIRGFTEPARYLEHALEGTTDLDKVNTPNFQGV
jgi:hypothetical protein